MKNILFVLCTIFVLSSCEKVLFKPNMGSKDPLKNFDYLWEEVDKKCLKLGLTIIVTSICVFFRIISF